MRHCDKATPGAMTSESGDSVVQSPSQSQPQATSESGDSVVLSSSQSHPQAAVASCNAAELPVPSPSARSVDDASAVSTSHSVQTSSNVAYDITDAPLYYRAACTSS